MSSDITKRGIEMAKNAIQHDRDQDYEKALSVYTQACEYLMKGRQCTSNRQPTTARSTSALLSFLFFFLFFFFSFPGLLASCCLSLPPSL